MGASFLGSSSVNSCATYIYHIICSRQAGDRTLTTFSIYSILRSLRKSSMPRPRKETLSEIPLWFKTSPFREKAIPRLPTAEAEPVGGWSRMWLET
jgi:hypothetical protein